MSMLMLSSNSYARFTVSKTKTESETYHSNCQIAKNCFRAFSSLLHLVFLILFFILAFPISHYGITYVWKLMLWMQIWSSPWWPSLDNRVSKSHKHAWSWEEPILCLSVQAEWIALVSHEHQASLFKRSQYSIQPFRRAHIVVGQPNHSIYSKSITHLPKWQCSFLLPLF